ncbi:MAG: L-seryl-tRNA(Sec) selenium transferase [Spirochaetales bacterium]|uniref:L-seryl-tRNA(Sec) selenium transferase n=1 Tax=Candidatus Thalassospirochaeta sargassi TaxID=3119039 RepID=A0AAJ1IG69_9SPIO|nr:L-seryl-tRNA(Sec) selenium transferase [Spirochaetales bacterium]
MNNLEIRKIPQTEQILSNPRITIWYNRISRQLTSAAVHSAIEHSRSLILDGGSFDEDALYMNIEKLCARLYNRRIRPLINASGVILHTNMGRSPIEKEVWNSCEAVNTGYSSLELSLKTGKRGKRNGLVPFFLNTLTGAESSAVVNNNAAAVYLMLSTFAAGKQVIVSRGEQVQIGGGFRIPEILRLSGAELVEVGTTNITTLDDYLDAITENTALILKVHRSNFAVRGFTSEPTVRELSEIIPDHVLIAVDQGSGVLNENIAGEDKVKSLLGDGADIVTFSGDKILGGPQAGILAGKTELIKAVDQNPLIRTMRPGKTIYSLLETSLLLRLNSPNAWSRHAEFIDSGDVVKDKCKKLKRGLSTEKYKLISDRICLGGGSTPDQFFESWSIEIVSEKMKPQAIIDELRNAEIPIIGKINGDSAVLNPAVFTDDDQKYVKSVLKALEEKL